MIIGVTWAAAIGVVLSVTSLVWQIAEKIRGRARVRVGVEATHRVDTVWDVETGEHDFFNVAEYKVIVENPGSADLTVFDVGLTADNRTLSLRIIENSWVSSQEKGSHQLQDFWVGAALPAVVPARGVQEWKLQDRMTHDYGDDVEWKGFAERYRAGKEPRRKKSKHAVSRLGADQ